MNREINRPRGFSFVEMPSEEEGNEAISGLNNKNFEGCSLSLSVARGINKRAGGFKSFSRSNNKRFF